MEFFTIHFERPLWLLSILPILWLAFRYYRLKLTTSNWEAVCDPELIEHVIEQPKTGTRKLAIISALVASALLVIAMAGPSWKDKEVPAIKSDSALVIALDLSRSMNAQDIKPSRLQRAKFKIEDLLKQRKDGQTALIVYAGDAFSVSPLTHDINTIIAQLPVFNPEIMPVQGNDIVKPLLLATKLLKQAGRQSGDILLITDDVNDSTDLDAFKAAAKAGYKVSVMGVGTTQGAPIPYQGSMIKDNTGSPVIAALDAKAMEQAANAGKGVYVKLSNNDQDISTLKTLFDQNKKSFDGIISELKLDTTEQEGAFFVLLSLPFLLFLFRKNAINVVAGIMIIPFVMPIHSEAAAMEDLWKNKNQQAAQLLADGKPEIAATLFENKRWKQIAAYQAKNYQQALNNTGEASSSEDWYNQGNVLAQLGNVDQAIAAYDEAISLNSNNEDAIFNKSLLEKMKQEQDQESKGQEPQEQESKGQESQDQESKVSGINEGEKTPDEAQEAKKQWLRSVSDDPALLWKRKFLYQYRQNNQQPASNGGKQW